MSALRRKNTDKVSQEIQYQTAALFTTYSGGGAWLVLSIGGREHAQAKLAVVFTIASTADFCGGFLWLFVVRACGVRVACVAMSQHVRLIWGHTYNIQTFAMSMLLPL